MFKSAATKIAHNSTLSAIGGNSDLKPLQDLITAEKSVLTSLRLSHTHLRLSESNRGGNSLQRLSLDLVKASEALRSWGGGEGDDLGDTLSASTAIIAHFSNSLAQYAVHEQSVREQMKAIRTREEALDELKRRRKSVGAKADSAERKLSKMSPEHKSLQMQTDTLNRLRDEMRSLDSEIMAEEAKLGDFKRTTTRTFMALKFGGLQELCAKGSIVGDFGMQITAEIPEDITQPGLPRSFYGGHGKTEWCMVEAQRFVGEVVFSGALGPSEVASTVAHTDYAPSPGGYASTSTPISNISNPQQQQQQQQYSPAQAYAASSSSPAWSQNQSIDDFGVSLGAPSGSMGANTPRLGAGGGRFATFPVKTRADAPPSLAVHSQRQPSLSFSSQVAEALSASANNSTTNVTLHANRSVDDAANYSVEESLPIYEPFGQSSLAAAAASYASGPPANPWNDEPRAPVNHTSNPNLDADAPGDEARSAYAGTSPAPDKGQGAGHVRYGSVSDIDEAMERSGEAARDPEDGGGAAAGDATPREVLDEPEPMVVRTQTQTRPGRVRVPSLGEHDEEELNAAAAREVGREMDALTFNPPLPPPPTDRGSSPAPPFASSSSAPLPPTPSDSPPAPPSNAASPQIPALSPPFITLPDRSLSSLSTTANSPYRTPMDSPLRSPGESPYRTTAQLQLASSMGTANKSSTSLSLSSPIPPTTRTISAAAFKRPAPRMPSSDSVSTGIADITPLAFKKRGPSVGGGNPTAASPSSPYPPRLPSTPNLRGPAAPSSYAPPSPSPVDAAHRRVPSSVPQNTFPDEDDQFDYITAYVNNMGPEEQGGGNGGGSPAQGRGPNNVGRSVSANPTVGGGGYAQGRFATNLGDDWVK